MMQRTEENKSEGNGLNTIIELTEQCLNNPTKSAIVCTELTMQISQITGSKSKWGELFENADDYFIQARLDEKMTYFLQNCIIIVEN